MNQATTSSSPNRIWRLARKELREILRDRRTIITLILMPVLLYPLLSIGFRQFLLSGTGLERYDYRIAVVTQREANTLAQLVGLGEEEVKRDRQRHEPPEKPTVPDPNWKLFESKDPKADVQANRCDIGVQIKATEGTEKNMDLLALNVEIYWIPDSTLSREAAGHLRTQLEATNRRLMEERWQRATKTNASQPILSRLVTVEQNQRKTSGFVTTLIPLILILMTITGAVYPAIDLTAGERERGTLEMLMAAPIPRIGLLTAKFIAVLAVTMLTALVNITMMTLTILVSGLGPVLFGSAGLSISLVLQILGLLLLLALFFSAMLLAITSFARSFKEAQSYLIPLMLVSMAPGMVALLPGIELQGILSVVPLVNVVLMARDLFDGVSVGIHGVVVVVSTLIYASVAIAIAARIFGAEAVLYREEGGWGDLFRRPVQPVAYPTITNALMCLALVFPAHFIITGGLSQLEGMNTNGRLMISAIVAICLFVGFPLAAAWLGRVNPTSGLQLYQPKFLSLIGAILLGLTLWPIVAEVTILLHQLDPVSNSILEKLKPVAERLKEANTGILLITMALIPAIAEELLFRGYLIRALRPITSARVAIVTSALIFGFFHLIISNVILWERLVSTTLLGLVLGYVCWKTGSVFPGMLLHACNNATILLLSKRPEFEALFSSDANQHVPITWLLGSILIVSTVLVFFPFTYVSRETLSQFDPTNPGS